MGGALVYLTVCSLRNRVLVRVKRLREPRYLFGSIAGLIYFYFLLLRPRASRAGRPPFRPLTTVAQYQGPLALVGGILLLAGAALAWLLPGTGRPALAFSPADVQFLFPAPVTRRQLLHYKLLRSQLGALMGSVLLTFILRPGTLSSGWTFFAGMLVAMATLNLYLTGVSLRRESLIAHGRAGLLRQGGALALILAALVIVAVAVAAQWATLTSLRDPRAVLQALEQIGSSGAARIALFPFVALVRLPLSSTPADFFRALPAAAAILAVNYVWVLRSDVAFEEASAELAEEVAKRKSDPRSTPVARRASPVPFSLAPQGRPELAILWKNLIAMGRYVSVRTFVRFLPPLIIGGGLMARTAGTRGVAPAISFLCLFCAGITLFLGPQMARNDFRQDLAYLPVLKAWPVRGAAIVAGEVLAPAALLSGIIWLFLIGAVAFVDPEAFGGLLAGSSRLSYAVAAMVLAPGLILTQIILHNAMALVFPDWVQIGGPRVRGVEVIGQRLLMMAGLLITVVVALLPAALVGAIAGLAIYAVTHVVPVIVPALVTTAALVIECAIAVELLGRVFDRMDLQSVTAVE